MKRLCFLLVSILYLTNCAVRPRYPFLEENVPPAPNYATANHWAALPGKDDPADRTPGEVFTDRQTMAAVDVFFVHPTTFTKGAGKDVWNADVNDAELNEKTDQGTILHQASIFNGVGRVFAPRYRQANIHAYFTKNKQAAGKAFALAYTDVKTAFEYYLQHYNEGRPIIVASHSQGTTHTTLLLKEYFDGKPLQSKLVVAYLVGMPVRKDQFDYIPACETADQISCYVSWRTYKKGYYPDYHNQGEEILATNPLLWTIDESYAPKDLNKGAVLRKFDRGIYPNLTDAQVKDGLLWVNKPKFPGSFLILTKNYHIADYNFFYANVRKNAQTRAAAFLEKRAIKKAPSKTNTHK